MVTKTQIDAALDALGKYDSPAVALGELLDRNGAWDWDDGSDHIPYDRTAVIESSGAWWAVYRGTEGDEAYHFGTKIEALATARRWQTRSESIFWKPYRHRDRTRQSSRRSDDLYGRAKREPDWRPLSATEATDVIVHRRTGQMLKSTQAGWRGMISRPCDPNKFFP